MGTSFGSRGGFFLRSNRVEKSPFLVTVFKNSDSRQGHKGMFSSRKLIGKKLNLEIARSFTALSKCSIDFSVRNHENFQTCREESSWTFNFLFLFLGSRRNLKKNENEKNWKNLKKLGGIKKSERNENFWNSLKKSLSPIRPFLKFQNFEFFLRKGSSLSKIAPIPPFLPI